MFAFAHVFNLLAHKLTRCCGWGFAFAQIALGFINGFFFRHSARYIIRSETLDQLTELRPRVHRCFEAGALATGAKIAITGGDKPYAEMRHDATLAALYRRNSEALGRPFPDLGEWETRPTGSTDMGNVSLAMPSIHPMIGINSLPAVNHQPEFAAHCVTADADKALEDGALAMAWTCIDLATSHEVREGLMACR